MYFNTVQSVAACNSVGSKHWLLKSTKGDAQLLSPSSLWFHFRCRLNSTQLCCEAMVYTMCRKHCLSSKPGDKRAMYNACCETPAVGTAVTWSQSTFIVITVMCFSILKKNGENKANCWNTVVQYIYFVSALTLCVYIWTCDSIQHSVSYIFKVCCV